MPDLTQWIPGLDPEWARVIRDLWVVLIAALVARSRNRGHGRSRWLADVGDSSVNFFVYCFTKTAQWVKFHEVKQEIMLRIADIITANPAQVAFPTSTIHLANTIRVKDS